MVIYNINEVITDVNMLYNGYVVRDGFVFTSIGEPTNVYDAIVVRHPQDAQVFGRLGISAQTLEAHIELINLYKIEKAVVIADSIEFLASCPTLKKLRIFPAHSAMPGFDYSPLYNLSGIEELCCDTTYGEREQFTTTIDYSKISGLKRLSICGEGHLKFNKASSLEYLFVASVGSMIDLQEISFIKSLKELTLLNCGVKSLVGVEELSTLEKIHLWHNRKLEDISALAMASDVLRELDVEKCPKITDFSILNHLHMLRCLSLDGNNCIPNLDFLTNMNSLETFATTMNVLDGNLIPCLSIPHVNIKNRKHYNIKNSDLPKRNKR